MVRSTFSALALAGALLIPTAGLAAPEEVPEAAPDVIEAPVEIEAGVPRLPDGTGFDDRVVFDRAYDDVMGMGEEVTVTGTVQDNAFLMGQDVLTSAPLGGDLFAGGETITIDEPIAGDLYALGAEVVLGPRASVGGDVYGLSGELRLEGPVGGSVHVGAGRVELASTIGGDVELRIGELVIEPGARIDGDLDYIAPRPFDVDSIVAGTVTFTEDTDMDAGFSGFEPEPPTALEAVMAWTGWRIWDYLSKLLVGAVFIALGGVAAARVSQTLREAPAESLGIGFLTLIVLPVASVLCIATVIPMSLGFLGLLTWGVLLFLGQIVTAQWLGELIFGAARPESAPTPYAALAVGLVPVSILFGVPWLAFLAVLTASLLGMGAVVKAIVRRNADEATA